MRFIDKAHAPPAHAYVSLPCMTMEMLSVLVEFRDSKRPVEATPDTLMAKISQVMRGIDPYVVIVKSLADFNGDGKPFLLQRYSTIWNEYIDVIDPMEIDDGDRVKVVPFPRGSV